MCISLRSIAERQHLLKVSLIDHPYPEMSVLGVEKRVDSPTCVLTIWLLLVACEARLSNCTLLHPRTYWGLGNDRRLISSVYTQRVPCIQTLFIFKIAFCSLKTVQDLTLINLVRAMEVCYTCPK